MGSSRIYTNSYASLSNAMAFPYRNKGTSFGGLSKPQYSYITFNSLAYLGAGVGARASRYDVAHGLRHPFIPPK
jgi:hypothetical protein